MTQEIHSFNRYACLLGVRHICHVCIHTQSSVCCQVCDKCMLHCHTTRLQGLGQCQTVDPMFDGLLVRLLAK